MVLMKKPKSFNREKVLQRRIIRKINQVTRVILSRKLLMLDKQKQNPLKLRIMMKARRKEDSNNSNNQTKNLKEGLRVDWSAEEMRTLSIAINIMVNNTMTMMKKRIMEVILSLEETEE
jgi:hypothetical protein